MLKGEKEMNKEEAKMIVKHFEGKEENIYDFLTWIDSSKFRDNIIYTYGEQNGRIPPVIFDYLRALCYVRIGGDKVGE